MLIDRLPMILLLLAVSILLAGLIIAVLSRLLLTPVRVSVPSAGAAGIVLLFQGGILSDATAAGQEFLAHTRLDRPDLSNISAHLSRQFPDLGDRIRALRRRRIRGGEEAEQIVNAAEGKGMIRLRAEHGLIRMTLSLPDQPHDVHGQMGAMRDELETLRSIAEDAPQLIWKQDQDGSVIWANVAYLRLADALSPTPPDADPLWPGKPLLAGLDPVDPDTGPKVQRVPVMLPDRTEPQWFEVTSLARAGGTVHFAVDANSAMQAEHSRQKFVQTLTKTFAHLSIGLAIFDRDRRLVLFNPAFLDLTGLQVGFLSGRPLVNSVLDRLRDMNMLPEPKNYTSWRDQVAALEAAAVRGTYCETWSLPSGRTYRVTGRPHPDGAIAFLFEDISDEVLLTRHYRSELETAQAALDSMDEGIAIFSRAGTLILSNDAYAEIWGRGHEGLQDTGIDDEVGRWQDRCAPSPVWDQLRGGLRATADRPRWQDTLRLDDGRAMICRVVPLAGGSTLIGFRFVLAETFRPVPAVEALGTEFRRSRPRGAAGG